MNDLPTPSTPTLADVAEAAGVSQATASRVLNGSRRVAPSYRARVRAAAEELGYAANLWAQATARGTASVVALLVGDIADPYFGQIASGVARGADEVGLVMTIAATQRDSDTETKLVRTLRGLRPHGMILAVSRAVEMAPALKHELDTYRGAGGTIVALGKGAGDVRSVDVDNRGGALALGAALTDIGYRRAVVFGAPIGVRSSDDRIAGFNEGFLNGGGEVTRVFRAGYTRESGCKAMAEALQDGLSPGTLVFGVSDVISIGAMATLRESGRRPGDDIAIAGFNNTETGRDVTPSLTTVHIPLEEVGYQALRATVDEIWKPDYSRLKLEVMLRESTPGIS